MTDNHRHPNADDITLGELLWRVQNPSPYETCDWGDCDAAPTHLSVVTAPDPDSPDGYNPFVPEMRLMCLRHANLNAATFPNVITFGR